jgi:hypothetical protein
MILPSLMIAMPLPLSKLPKPIARLPPPNPAQARCAPTSTSKTHQVVTTAKDDRRSLARRGDREQHLATSRYFLRAYPGSANQPPYMFTHVHN